MGITDSGCSVGVPQSRMGQMGGMGKGYSAGRQDCGSGGSNSAGKQGRNNNLKFKFYVQLHSLKSTRSKDDVIVSILSTASFVNVRSLD